MKYKTIRLSEDAHKELIKSVSKAKKRLNRNVTASELISSMIRQGSWSK